MTTRAQPCVALKKPYDDKRVSHHRAAGGRCIAAGRWHAKAPSPAPSPPLGSRGRGPWSGRGSQRVKPRLVSPFEKEGCLSKDRDSFVWSAPGQGPTFQSSSDSGLEIPRLALLARDDSYIELLGFLGGKGLALLSKSDTMTKESLNRATGGRCIAAGRWHAKGATTARCPPSGSRGRGPWSGRGSQRVKPRLVSPFEKRRLSPKGQEFLRVVDPRARPCHPRR